MCRHNGLLVKEATSSAYLEYFIKGTEPKGICIIPKPPPQDDGEKDQDQDKNQQNRGNDGDKKDGF